MVRAWFAPQLMRVRALFGRGCPIRRRKGEGEREEEKGRGREEGRRKGEGARRKGK